jgi:3-hydroxyacyl-CoA dehydrogenase
VNIKKVAVLGSGLIGSGLCITFAKDPSTSVVLRSHYKKQYPLKSIRRDIGILIETDVI